MRARIISIDEYKKLVPNYNPDNAEDFHEASYRLSEKAFAEALKDKNYKKVIFLCGGSASGKTEFMYANLSERKAIVLDGTFSTNVRAKIKIESVKKLGKRPIVIAVIPKDIGLAFLAFLNRDRKFPESYFYKTHCGARKTLLYIQEKYCDLDLEIYESYYRKGKTIFIKLRFDNKSDMVKYLKDIQLEEDDIINTIQGGKL